MIQLPKVDLPASTITELRVFQKSIDELKSYADQVEMGQRFFASKRKSKTMKTVENHLYGLCSGARRCCYCEDSAATDIEHIWPKSLYPNLTFEWEKYLYGCTRCNRPKWKRCEIYLPSGIRYDVAAKVQADNGPPPPGLPLLINPRIEDPMDLMLLDIKDTFYFLPLHSKNTREWERAQYTIEILQLNAADVLPVSRAEAFKNYVARMDQYIAKKMQQTPKFELDHYSHSILRMGHPTVWREMKRQRAKHPLIEQIFTVAPEAMLW